jgi:hypothetical protein
VTDETLELDAAGLGPLVTLAVVQYWGYVVVGVVGAWWLRRRGRPLVPLVVPVVTVLVVSLMAYGSLRFRIAFDAALPVLVGVGAAALLARIAGARASPPPIAPGAGNLGP